jgi:precorrin-6B C5,15-methyltransferase / cobalt-precorrin-6B C5,C15-methyltransferase
MTCWLTIVGMGDDGLDGLGPASRAVIESAELLVGGERHQGLVPASTAQRLTWADGLDAALDQIERWRGRRVVVLATGDPMCHGAGANFRRRFDATDMTIIPFPGAFTLACARMLWTPDEVETLSVHRQSLEILNGHITPGNRLVVLARDGATPARVADLLKSRGFGPSRLTVLEHMGGRGENRLEGTADSWNHERCADLNTLAIECVAGPHARYWPRTPGLPESAFEHDGRITKREVRAAALAALAPLPGQVLWDVGAGSGAIAIEWLRAERTARAVAIERRPDRRALIARNALFLGVPHLEIVDGEAPAALADLAPNPDAIFVGGGFSAPGLLQACWKSLSSGGRLVANAVTLEAEEKLLRLHGEQGGDLVRIAVARAEPVGRFSGFKPLMQITQYAAVKP